MPVAFIKICLGVRDFDFTQFITHLGSGQSLAGDIDQSELGDSADAKVTVLICQGCSELWHSAASDE